MGNRPPAYRVKYYFAEIQTGYTSPTSKHAPRTAGSSVYIFIARAAESPVAYFECVNYSPLTFTQFGNGQRV